MYFERDYTLVQLKNGYIRLIFRENRLEKYQMSSTNARNFFFPSKDFAASPEASQMVLNRAGNLSELSIGQRLEVSEVATALGYQEPVSDQVSFAPASRFPLSALKEDEAYHLRDTIMEQLDAHKDFFEDKTAEILMRTMASPSEKKPTTKVRLSKEGCSILIKDRWQSRTLVLHPYPLPESEGTPNVAILGYSLFERKKREVQSLEFLPERGKPDENLIKQLFQEEGITKDVAGEIIRALEARGYNESAWSSKRRVAASQVPKETKKEAQASRLKDAVVS